ncbi:MAG: TraR/DksA C4-type zinc finger protein [Candidatus Aenigmatarchaeota archaeon]
MDIEEIKKILIKSKEELEILLNEVEENTNIIKDNPEIEQSDIAEQTEEKLDFYTKKTLLQERLNRINKALKRIEEGVYGICVKCGNKIEELRLKIDPTTELCRKCSI